MNPQVYNLRQLPIPVPGVLPDALGYTGEAGFFSLFWEPMSEEYPALFKFWDGHFGAGARHSAYVIYLRHPAVAPHLVDFDLGNADRPAVHRLVFDREQQAVWIGTVEDGSRLLQDQWPPADPQEQWSQALDLLIDSLRKTDESFQLSEETRVAQAVAREARQTELLNELRQALDAYLSSS